MSLAAVAAEIGLSKGRITQIRQSAPPPERGLFGVGPIRVAVPTRAMPGRGLPVISAEDSIAAERMTTLLMDLGFVGVELYRIPIGGLWTPVGDVVAICGPKSSQVTAEAISTDPYLDFSSKGGRWAIQDRHSGKVFLSGMDDDPGRPQDVAYVGRLRYGPGSVFLIAGIHAIGSVGAVHFLAGHAADLYTDVGDGLWSGVISSSHDGEAITGSEWACPPRRHG